jgi:hypothetical protein
MTWRAFALSPPILIFSAVGPMKVIPEVAQASVKWGFSERKPYPGWIASESVTSAALRIAGMFM